MPAQLRRTAASAAFALLAASAATAQQVGATAQPQEIGACEFRYVIQAGDTLPHISETAFGRQQQQYIYSRNSDRFDMLGVLPEGEILIVPCADGQADFTPDSRALSSEMLLRSWTDTTDKVKDADSANLLVQDYPPGVARLLTADGHAPYIDRMMRNGGFFAELVIRALNESPDLVESKTVFVDDRAIHLNELLADGAFDIGFPWLMPPCNAANPAVSLTAQETQLCQNFTFSAPIFEGVSGVFVQKDRLANITSHGDLAGARICTPQSDDLSVIKGAGLTKNTASFVHAASPAGCFGMLIANEVDAVVADSHQGALALRALNADKLVVEHTELSMLKTLHAIAPKSKPGAAALLENLNAGLTNIRDSGQWFKVVSYYLKEGLVN